MVCTVLSTCTGSFQASYSFLHRALYFRGAAAGGIPLATAAAGDRAKSPAHANPARRSSTDASPGTSTSKDVKASQQSSFNVCLSLA